MIRHLAAAGAVAFALTGGLVLADAAAAQQTGANDMDRGGGRGSGVEKRFEKLDRNNDGAVDRSEIERRLSRAFARADKNGDGVVDREEASQLSERGSGKGKKGGRAAKRFQKADSDRDGRVTKDEFLDQLPGWFRRADADRDERVTREELDQYMASRKGKGGKKKNRDGM